MMRILIPPKGHDWNPLRHYRNIPCACGSGRKAKRCHGAADTLPTKDILMVKAYLRELSRSGVIEARKGEIS